jgi:hypothetical protein
MVKVLIAVAVVLLGVSSEAQSKCGTYDTRNDPMCQLPEVWTSHESNGYVSARGTWTPDGFIDKADIKIECLRRPAPHLSVSKLGACQMASAVIIDDMPVVALNDFDVVLWKKTKIVAERDEAWQMDACKNQQMVIDFPSNTVTLTSTLNRSGDCGKRHEDQEQLLKMLLQPPLKDVEVFSLVHNLGARFADADGNSFFQKTK